MRSTCCLALPLALAQLRLAGADTVGVQAVALFDYPSLEPDELSLSEGDTLTIVSSADGEDGWVRGWHNSEDGWIGLVPLNYLRLIRPLAANDAARATTTSTAAGAAFSTAVAAALDEADSVGGSDDPALGAALRRYRRRRAAYNGNADLLEQRWGVRLDSGGVGGGADLAAEHSEPTEHRSGVAGVPFFNLVAHMEASLLSRELCAILRDDWLPDGVDRSSPALLAGLDQALRAAAAASASSRDVILTFANLGYADFVTNGFEEQKNNTLVIALDPQAHALLTSRGYHSFFDAGMPTMPAASAEHTSAAFMDIMKLRLLYLAEVLERGYNALLTDADAIFHSDSPFGVFPPKAHIVVACDSTIVPSNWRQAPGMVMAGFFYARAGPRPIILIKEVLDYQLRHPEQHDQQSFNMILSELYVADLEVAVMHPRLFPNGFQFFNKRTVQREGGTPLVVQNNWIMGAENKRHRFREAGMWSEDDESYFRGTAERPLRLIRYDPRQPFVSGLLRETSALMAAFRVALLTNRTLVLPGTCAFTTESGLTPPPPLVYRDRDGLVDTNVLDDTVDADWCTAEWFYDMDAMRKHLPGQYRQSNFLSHPLVRTDGLATPPSIFIEASPEWRRVPPPPHAQIREPADLSRGATDDEIRAWLAPHGNAPLIELGDMAGRIRMPAGGAGDDEAGSLRDRIALGVVYREEIERYVRQQVQAATPFECLCVPDVHGHSGSSTVELSSHARSFAKSVPRSTAVFIASYRVDLDERGLEAFREMWDHVYALALYDWNGAGLQGMQFSSTINRLVCERAQRVHWPDGVSPRSSCW